MTKKEIREQILNWTTPSLGPNPVKAAENIYSLGNEAVSEVIDISRNSTPKDSRRPNQVSLIEAIIRFASDGNEEAIDYLHEVAEEKIQFVYKNNYSIGYPIRAAQEFFSSQKKSIDKGQEDKSIDTDPQEDEILAEFETFCTNDPGEAVEILFNKAILAVPCLSEKQVHSAYQDVQKSWSSRVLVNGTIEYVKQTVLTNAKKLSQQNDFRNFQINIYNAKVDSGYRNAECAQVMAFTTNGFIPIRLWRTKQEFFACGNSNFRKDDRPEQEKQRFKSNSISQKPPSPLNQQKQKSHKSTQKILGIGLVFIVVIGIILAIFPTSRDEIHWLWTSYKKHLDSYNFYLQKWPNGRHSENARDAIELIQWEEATTIKSWRLLQNYLDAYPNGHFVEEAKSKQAAFLKDDSLFEETQISGRGISYWEYPEHAAKALTTFLNEFPGHRKEAEAQMRLKDIQGRNINELVDEKKIAIIDVSEYAMGSDEIHIKIRRLVPYSTMVIVPVGTYFTSQDPKYSDVVVTKEDKLILQISSAEEQVVGPTVVPANCNKLRATAGPSDQYTLLKLPEQDDLVKLMSILARTGVSYAIQQGAIWIANDNADYEDLGCLVERQFLGDKGKRLIQEYEAAMAMKICEEAGIDLTQKLIWEKSREQILRFLEDEELRKWLEDKQ